MLLTQPYLGSDVYSIQINLNSFAFNYRHDYYTIIIMTIGVMRQNCPFLSSCQMDLGPLAPALEVAGGHTIKKIKLADHALSKMVRYVLL
jgi:hypothetical protein